MQNLKVIDPKSYKSTSGLVPNSGSTVPDMINKDMMTDATNQRGTQNL